MTPPAAARAAPPAAGATEVESDLAAARALHAALNARTRRAGGSGEYQARGAWRVCVRGARLAGPFPCMSPHAGLLPCNHAGGRLRLAACGRAGRPRRRWRYAPGARRWVRFRCARRQRRSTVFELSPGRASCLLCRVGARLAAAARRSSRCAPRRACEATHPGSAADILAGGLARSVARARGGAGHAAGPRARCQRRCARARLR
jgi:hypothetical protein